jgi:hypothetical protein
MPKLLSFFKTGFFTAFLTFMVGSMVAQQSPANPPKIADNEEDSVKNIINVFFEGLNKGDTGIMKKSIAEGMSLQTIAVNRKGEAAIRNETVAEFFTQVAVRPPEIKSMEEKITFGTILIDGPMASVWTPYNFFVNGQLYHCGVNSFQLVKTVQGWRIAHIIDTRRRKGCE